MAGRDDDDAKAEAEALRINTLHRFAKHSPRLVLHEYSHCEVPAGCGGVVLRWLDPATGRPCIIDVTAIGMRATVWLDGEPLASSLCNVRDGLRILALELARRAPTTSDGRADAEATPGPKPFVVDVHPDGLWDHKLLAGAAANASYRMHVGAPPPAGWQVPGFDATAWPSAPPCPAASIKALDEWRRRVFDRMRDGAHAVPAEHDRAWVRIAFIARVPARPPR